MKARRKKAVVAAVITVLFSVAADRITKAAVTGALSLGESIPKEKSFLSIFYTRNEGIAFSMFDGADARWILVGVQVVLVAVVSVFLCHVIRKRPAVFTTTSLSLVIGGGIGNLIDRICYGSVIDFISIGSFPVFNLADSCLTVGCFILIVHLLFGGDYFKKT